MNKLVSDLFTPPFEELPLLDMGLLMYFHPKYTSPSDKERATHSSDVPLLTPFLLPAPTPAPCSCGRYVLLRCSKCHKMYTSRFSG